MGVMKPAVEDAGSVKAWLMPGGWGCRKLVLTCTVLSLRTADVV
jgi:hypothetical protein